MLARIACDGVFSRVWVSVVLCQSLSGGGAEHGCGAAFGRGAHSEMSEHGNSQGEDEARAYAHLPSIERILAGKRKPRVGVYRN